MLWHEDPRHPENPERCGFWHMLQTFAPSVVRGLGWLRSGEKFLWDLFYLGRGQNWRPRLHAICAGTLLSCPMFGSNPTWFCGCGATPRSWKTCVVFVSASVPQSPKRLRRLDSSRNWDLTAMICHQSQSRCDVWNLKTRFLHGFKFCIAQNAGSFLTHGQAQKLPLWQARWDR